LDLRFWIYDFGFTILELRFWIYDFGFWIFLCWDMKMIVCFLVFSSVAFGQRNEFWSITADNQLKINKRGMQSLVAWSSVNILGGTMLATQTSGRAQAFHASNALWNTVNLTLGITGLIQAKRTNFDSYTSYFAAQQKVERIFLINFGIDFVYIGTGISLMQSDIDRNKGISQSLVLQGAYLAVFDGIMYLIHRKNGKLKWTTNSDQSLSFGLQPSGFRIRFQF
jgi:hypothetical protein